MHASWVFSNAENHGCADNDECALGTDICAPDATCTNALGGYSCACNTGFTGNGVSCAGDCLELYNTPSNAGQYAVSTSCMLTTA